MPDNEPSPSTLVAQALHYIDRATGAIVPPIHPATTFARGEDYQLLGDFIYGRYGGPTVEHAERVIAALEGGAAARLFASGLAAFAAVFEIVEAGRHIVAPRVMYHGGQDWLRRISAKRGIGLTLFDPTEPGALRAAVRPGGETALVWIETPVNPTWDVIDIADAAEVARAAGAALGVDSTVAPPCTTRPLELGADIVLHSGTKYLNGHSDVTAGALVTGAPDDARWGEIDLVRRLTGGVIGPFDAWLLLRGMRTLFLRYERCSANAMRIAQHFEGHPGVERVLYPGLESHPGHAIARRQMTGGFGGMLSLLVRGDADAAKRVAGGVRLFVPATSLGGVESLIEHRRSVEGPASTVPPNLLRLSVGIEDVRDLIEDLERVLERA